MIAAKHKELLKAINDETAANVGLRQASLMFAESFTGIFGGKNLDDMGKAVDVYRDLSVEMARLDASPVKLTAAALDSLTDRVTKFKEERTVVDEGERFCP